MSPVNFPLGRRQFLSESAWGLSSLALTSLLADENQAASPNEPSSQTHFKPTARQVILLFMSGGPSQVDTFDPKPELDRLSGRDVPATLAKNVPRIKRAGLRNLMASPFKFARHGQSGLPVSELFPATAKHIDDLCVIRSMHHRNPVHGPGECVALTGTAAGDRPSLGSWITYGLGNPSRELPAFIAMNLNTDGMQYPQPAGWEAGFLPARYQATVVKPQSGIAHVRMPAGVEAKARRRQLELLNWMNRRHLEKQGQHSELEARVRTYEMAWRLQSSAPELFALADETDETRQLYGIGEPTTERMGLACLLARRMIQRRVRFVQIRYGGWDAHGNLAGNHQKLAAQTDVPVAALLEDLKRHGLLDETLVVWGGEFGRTPTMEGRGKGRDHNPSGYAVWMAGGGVQGGQAVGATDPIGYVPIQRPIRPSDVHATMLHALGLDQYQLTWLHHGRKELATVLGGDVVHEVFG